MDFTSFVDAFDLFADCYVYGCVIYLLGLFIYHLSCSFLALVDECHHQTETKPDLYQQVKELLNPATEEILELDVQPSFDNMTIRELRSYIKENHLQQQVRDCLGKTVSNARKYELIKALS